MEAVRSPATQRWKRVRALLPSSVSLQEFDKVCVPSEVCQIEGAQSALVYRIYIGATVQQEFGSFKMADEGCIE